MLISHSQLTILLMNGICDKLHFICIVLSLSVPCHSINTRLVYVDFGFGSRILNACAFWWRKFITEDNYKQDLIHQTHTAFVCASERWANSSAFSRTSIRLSQSDERQIRQSMLIRGCCCCCCFFVYFIFWSCCFRHSRLNGYLRLMLIL